MSNPGDSSPRVEIPGSTRDIDPSWEQLGPADPAAPAVVSVYVRDPAGSPDTPAGVSRAEYQAAHRATDADIQSVLDFAAEFGLAVGEISPERRSVQLTGTVDALSQAFGAPVGLYRHPDFGVFRGRTGPLTIPAHLGPVVTGVFGLDNRMAARAQFRPAVSPSIQYTPPQVAQAYNFPTTATGAGECVAILEFGGGFRVADITAYFQQLGIKAPTVLAVSVDGGTNAPSTASSADGEVMLDIEVIGGLAPAAKIAVYFAPNSEQGFVDAITTAANDTTNKPSVISISWGGPENSWTQQAIQQIEQACIAATTMGVTVTAASGDNGSTDGQSDGTQHADFPSSAPHILGCGGTSLQASGTQITSETVWNSGSSGGATGGGISDVWPVPTYQQNVSLPPSVNDGQTRRGVPDVAGDADPATGWTVRVDGQTIPIGGTSAVAPMWAGLIALLNEALGKPVGFVHPALYASAAAATFHDITQGNNGSYNAGPGWDACTGLGSPNGAALLSVLQGTSGGTGGTGGSGGAGGTGGTGGGSGGTGGPGGSGSSGGGHHRKHHHEEGGGSDEYDEE
jgi:kumamolisin